MASGKSKFEKSLERYLNESRSFPSSDWCLAALENSFFLSLWDAADEQLLKDCRVAMRVVAHEILDSLEAEMAEAVATCASPIERRLFLALLVVGRHLDALSIDRARDRKLKKLGYEVFRYTGLDIYNDPFKCAMDAWDMVARSVQSLKRDFDKKCPVTMDDLLD